MQAPNAALDTWRRQALPLPLALLASVAALLCLACLLLWRRPAPPPPPPVVRITIATPAPPAPVPPPPVAAPPQPLAAPPVPAPPVQQPPIQQPPTKPLALRPRHLHPTPRHPSRPIRPVEQPAPPQATPPAPSATPAVPTRPSPPASDRAARDTLQGRIRQAIKAAFQYPEAARAMAAHGTVLVGFLYRDRSVTGVHVIRASASPILDRAAVAIVASASMPPPGRLAGQTLSLELPIVFDIASDDDD